MSFGILSCSGCMGSHPAKPPAGCGHGFSWWNVSWHRPAGRGSPVWGTDPVKSSKNTERSSYWRGHRILKQSIGTWWVEICTGLICNQIATIAEKRKNYYLDFFVCCCHKKKKKKKKNSHLSQVCTLVLVSITLTFVFKLNILYLKQVMHWSDY